MGKRKASPPDPRQGSWLSGGSRTGEGVASPDPQAATQTAPRPRTVRKVRKFERKGKSRMTRDEFDLVMFKSRLPDWEVGGCIRCGTGVPGEAPWETIAWLCPSCACP
jgi:hypothetical protein